MSTALSLIKSSLRKITSYQSGETIAQSDQADLLEVLNDLLDSWSIQKLNIFGTNEWVLQWTATQSKYKVGNPTCTAIGEPPFSGTLVGGTNTITATSVPLDLAVGATLTDVGAVIPAGQTVTGISGNIVTFGPGVAVATPSIGLDQITYTIPGDLAIPRPLRITGGFTRINSLDFWLDVYATQEQYTQILYKAQPGPWPTIAWYNPQMPYGILNVYQAPGNSAELHLFTDTILSNLTINQTFILPQGYAWALKWNLARAICAEYGYPETPTIKHYADQSLKEINALNALPAARAKYDRQLVRGNRPDGGWILHGGYY
jgi:hypothetical protein